MQGAQEKPALEELELAHASAMAHSSHRPLAVLPPHEIER